MGKVLNILKQTICHLHKLYAKIYIQLGKAVHPNVDAGDNQGNEVPCKGEGAVVVVPFKSFSSVNILYFSKNENQQICEGTFNFSEVNG